jgi:hypothetical protein
MAKKFLNVSVLLITIIVAAVRTLPPRALPVDAPVNQFSAERTIETIKAITGSPRLVGSPAFEAAKTTLLAQLANLGLETDVQNTTLDGVSVENVLGRLEGSKSTDSILLSAHLDSVSNSPGATDNASGVAIIMETVRALHSETPLRNTVIVLFTGPEENCCYGARDFVNQHPWAKDVRLVVNVDAGGLSGPSILSATGPNAGWLIEQAAGILPDPIGSSAIEALGSPITDYTMEFREDGFIGFDFNLSWDKRIHSQLDNINNLKPNSIQHQGEHVLAIVRQFGNLSLEIPTTPRPIYFDILGLTMVHYPVSWAVYLLLIVTTIFASMLFIGFRQKRLTLSGICFGAVLFLLSLLTVPVLLAVIQFVFIQPALIKNPDLGTALIGETLLSNSIRWGSAILALVSAFLWYILFRKNAKTDGINLAIGAYIFLFAGATWSTLAFPELSYLFIWPLLAGSLAMLPWFLSRKETTKQPGWFHFLMFLGAGIVAAIVFTSGIFIALVSIDIRMIYLVPIFIVTLLYFLIPAITDLGSSNA